MSTPVSPAPDTHYPSLAAFQAAHNELLRRQRQEHDTAGLADALSRFLQAGAATGVLLDSDDDRRAAQSLLDYWSARLFRLGEEPPDTTLADFDPLLAPEVPESLCPYLGLDAFREDDQGKFFGRRELVALLVARLADLRLLAVVGPSGSGKSSLVRAGLIPALKAAALPGSEGWRYLTPIVPGSAPMVSLEQALRSYTQATGTDDPITALDTPIVLIVDQFEELWTLCEDAEARRAFIVRLLELAEASELQHRVVLTMRSDFETYVARAPQLQALFAAGRVQVTPLSAAELREAIERPAEAAGLKFEGGVVDLLLQDILGEPAALPLLQFTLLKLWERRERNRVTRAAYDEVGGGRLALARSADSFYAGLIPEEQVTARRMLLRMVHPGEGLEITSSRVRRAELYQGGEDPGRVSRVLEKLIHERLLRLTPGETSDDDQVEVAHEALVRNWPTLVEWLEEERAALAVRRRLEGRAAEWVRLGQGSGGLLDEIELREAERWLDSSEAAYLGYDTVLPALVAASRAALERVAREQEAARELRLARTRRFAIMLAGLSIVAVLAAGFALLQTNVAQNAQAQAQAQGATADVLRQTAEANVQAIATKEVDARAARDTADVLRQTAEANVQAIATKEADARAARSTAVAQSLVIDTQRLAFAARSQGEDSELGLLLAYEAAARDNSQITRQALIDLINRRPRLLRTLDVHESTDNSNIDVVNDAEYSLDGKRVVTASNDGLIRIWQAATGAPIKTLNGHKALVNSAVFSPDGARIVSASWDGTAGIWDAENGTRLQTLTHPSSDSVPNYVNRAAFDTSGAWVATAARDGQARLWNAGNGELIATFQGHTGPIWDVGISPDRQYLATASNDQSARIWDIATRRSVYRLDKHTDRVRSVAFSPDSRRLVTSSDDGTAWTWDVQAGTPLKRMVASSGRLWFARFSPDGRHIVTVSDDGTARIWDAESGIELAVFGRNSGRLWSASYSPDGRQIITAADQGVAQIWDAVNWDELPVLAGPSEPIAAAAYTADASQIVTAAGADVRRWDVVSGEPLSPLQGQFSQVQGIAIGPDGTIATASDDRNVRLWDSSGVGIATFQGHAAPVTDIAFNQDGTRLVTSSSDGISFLWSRDGGQLATLKAPSLPAPTAPAVAYAAYSPDGSRIVTALSTGTAWLWDADGNLLDTFQEPNLLAGVGFGERGAHLLFIWADGTTRELDIATRQVLTTLRRSDGAVIRAEVSANGRRLMLVLPDNTVRQYLTDKDDLLSLAACRVDRGLTGEEIARFQVPEPLTFDFTKRQCPPAFGS